MPIRIPMPPRAGRHLVGTLAPLMLACCGAASSAQEADRQAAARVAAQEVPPAVAAQIDRLRPQYQRELYAELHAIRDICNPTLGQQRELLAVGKDALEASLKELAERLANPAAGNMRVWIGGPRRGGGRPAPSDAVRVALDTAVQRLLPEEAGQNLAREREKRAAFRRRAACRCLIVRLDEELLLTDKQREGLEAALMENWKRSWTTAAPRQMRFRQPVLSLPSAVVEPFLDADQKQAWRKLPKAVGVSGATGSSTYFRLQGLVPAQPFEPKPARP